MAKLQWVEEKTNTAEFYHLLYVVAGETAYVIVRLVSYSGWPGVAIYTESDLKFLFPQNQVWPTKAEACKEVEEEVIKFCRGLTGL
jgi:hypothetical protein